MIGMVVTPVSQGLNVLVHKLPGGDRGRGAETILSQSGMWVPGREGGKGW